MKSYELVAATIKGMNPGRTPLYAWLKANLTYELTREFGSVEAFEDHDAFDMAHLFGGPSPYDQKMLDDLKNSGQEITPECHTNCIWSDTRTSLASWEACVFRALWGLATMPDSNKRLDA